MRNTQNILLFLFIFGIILSTTTPIQAQKTDIVSGYYLSATGDSLPGQFYIGNLKDNVLKYKKVGVESWEKLSPKDIQVVRGDNDLYISTQSVVNKEDTALIFIQRILRGGYNLYEGAIENHVNVFFFNSLEKPTLIKVNPRGFEAQFQVYFGKCAEESKVKAQYSREKLLRYFHWMNACAYPGKKQVKNTKRLQPKFGLGISGGYYLQAAPKFGGADPIGLDKIAFPNPNHAYLGLSANLNLTPTFGIVAGVNYINKTLQSDSLSGSRYSAFLTTNPNTGEPFVAYITFDYRSVIAFKLQYLEVPIGFRIRLKPFVKSAPVVIGGLTFSFPLNVNLDKYWGTPYRVEYPAFVNPPPTVALGKLFVRKIGLDQPVLGLYTGVGWRWQLSKKHEAECMFHYFLSREKIRADVGPNVNNWGSRFDMVWHRFQFSANYYFQFGK